MKKIKITTAFLTGLVILIALIGLYAFKSKRNENERIVQDVKKTKVTSNPYPGLRSQSINVTSAQLQLQLHNDSEVFGIVMDWNMEKAIVTVVAFKTGDASVYLSTGQAFIGGFSHKTVNDAAKQFVATGEKYLSKATRTENTKAANEKNVDFYLLTNSGKYYLEDSFAKIENNNSDLNGLFEAANRVITEYRLITQDK
jgi:hypothetical protein